MFGFTIWLVIGGIIGWLTSIVTRADHQQAILANLIVGVVGAYSGGALIAPVMRVGTIFGYLTAIVGALLAISAYYLARRITLR
jgi:uncharacterized membrane protein YeaQ/YmgE (transglycosylase-associated protein family)